MIEKEQVQMKREGLTMQMDIEQFAMALKTWRLRQGMTQKELGAKWGMSRYTIIRAERGRNITWEFAYRIFARLSEELEREARKNTSQI